MYFAVYTYCTHTVNISAGSLKHQTERKSCRLFPGLLICPQGYTVQLCLSGACVDAFDMFTVKEHMVSEGIFDMGNYSDREAVAAGEHGSLLWKYRGAI